MAKRKAKKKAATKRKPSKVERTLVRLEKAIVHETSSIDALNNRIDRIDEFLGDELKTFHEKQPAASLTNGPQAGALVDPE
jgi:predicted RNase H-like nuclease (RuvC/YqgF family)